MTRNGWTWTWRLGAAPLALALLAAPGAAFAGDVCVHSTAETGWTFVLHKLKPKPGKSGAIDGYAVRDGDSLILPISGGYVVLPGSPPQLYFGATRYLSGLGTGGGGTSAETSFHQLYVDLEGGGSGGDYFWTRIAGGTLTDGSGETQRVDCAMVAKVPKQVVH